jgi:hypothetical protein
MRHVWRHRPDKAPSARATGRQEVAHSSRQVSMNERPVPGSGDIGLNDQVWVEAAVRLVQAQRPVRAQSRHRYAAHER